MKYLKKFESISQLPEVGDYVITKDIVNQTNKSARSIFGRITRINDYMIFDEATKCEKV